MLEIFQNLALCFLWKELEGNKLPVDDLRLWFIKKKENDPGCFFSYLVEPGGKIEKYYTLSADHENDDVAILESADIGSLEGQEARRLPFNKPSGPQSPQIGPVIKRSYNKGAGPSLKILNSTIKAFIKKSDSKHDWSEYFREVVDVMQRKTINYAGEMIDCSKHALHEAIKIIPEKKTVFLVYKDARGKLPGDITSYKTYLSTMLDADNKYTTKKSLSKQIDKCPLCNFENVKGYAAGISKAGINIFNIDREGAFAGVTNENAHLAYAICENCADLLYTFKFHVMGKYLTHIAGQESLLIPDLYSNPDLILKFLNRFQSYTDKLMTVPEQALTMEKKKLIKQLSKEDAICTIDIIWSKDSLKGQSIQKLSGHISDILPSRLRQIQQSTKCFNENALPFYPKYRVDNFDFDLNLSFVHDLFKRPGGKSAKNINISRRLIDLKRFIAECLYKDKQISEKRFWEEMMITAEWYLKNTLIKEKPEIDCLYEGFSDKKNKTWLTFAGWIKHMAMAVNYFTFMGVMKKMENKRTYSVDFESAKTLFLFF